MSETTCAIVVTYNRKELLRECLQALMTQTQQVDEILVVNNASNDGTTAMLRKEFPEVRVLNLWQNIGGAGGFHEGMKRVYGEEYDWIWLLDDDSIPEPTALEELFLALPILQTLDASPMLLASKAIWVDGDLHPINRPWPLIQKRLLFTKALERGYMLIRAASFVSVLLNRDAIIKYGLPYSDFFTWADDWEYTGRVLLRESGYLVPKSVVVHRTQRYEPNTMFTGPRLYYGVRNRIWLLKSSSFTWKEKMYLAWRTVAGVAMYLRCSSTSERLRVLRGYTAASLAGLLTSPKN